DVHVRFRRAGLAERRRVAGGVALELRNGLDDLFGSRDPTDAPAGHRERLRAAVDGDNLALQLVTDGSQRLMGDVAVDEVFVDLVRKGDDAGLLQHSADGLDFVRRV